VAEELAKGGIKDLNKVDYTVTRGVVGGNSRVIVGGDASVASEVLYSYTRVAIRVSSRGVLSSYY